MIHNGDSFNSRKTGGTSREAIAGGIAILRSRSGAQDGAMLVDFRGEIGEEDQ